MYSVEYVISHWMLRRSDRQIIVFVSQLSSTGTCSKDTEVKDVVFRKQTRLSNLHQISILDFKDYVKVKGESISLFRCTQKRWEGLVYVSSDAYLVLPRQNIMTCQFGVVFDPLAYP